MAIPAHRSPRRRGICSGSSKGAGGTLPNIRTSLEEAARHRTSGHAAPSAQQPRSHPQPVPTGSSRRTVSHESNQFQRPVDDRAACEFVQQPHVVDDPRETLDGLPHQPRRRQPGRPDHQRKSARRNQGHRCRHRQRTARRAGCEHRRGRSAGNLKHADRGAVARGPNGKRSRHVG